jgi:hypothetical protein
MNWIHLKAHLHVQFHGAFLPLRFSSHLALKTHQTMDISLNWIDQWQVLFNSSLIVMALVALLLPQEPLLLNFLQL